MQHNYNKTFFEYYEYILDVLNMCITDIMIECFPWINKPLKDKPSIYTTQKNKFEKYYDSEDSLEQEYDLV